MATSEHTDKIEIAASVAHSQEHQPLEPAAKNASQQEASITALDIGTFYDYYASFQNFIVVLSECFLFQESGTEDFEL